MYFNNLYCSVSCLTLGTGMSGVRPNGWGMSDWKSIVGLHLARFTFSKSVVNKKSKCTYRVFPETWSWKEYKSTLRNPKRYCLDLIFHMTGRFYILSHNWSISSRPVVSHPMLDRVYLPLQLLQKFQFCRELHYCMTRYRTVLLLWVTYCRNCFIRLPL